MWAIILAMVILAAAGIALVVRARRFSSSRVFPAGEDETSAVASLKDELSQLETEKLYGAISPEEYETAKQAVNVSLQRALARTQN